MSGDSQQTPATILEQVIHRFEDAWQENERPDIAAYLPADATQRQAVLPELVHADLEFRLKAGEPVRVETYLARFPELGSDAEVVVGLLAAEYELRRRSESDLHLDDYRRRFPQHIARLEARAQDTPTGDPDDEATVKAQSAPPPAAATGGPAPLARYRSVRLHARGGLGEVHLADDLELNRPVALKRMQERHAADPENRRRFLREAEVTARLGHPGIVPVYGLTHEADGRPCYAMRFIEGQSLQEAIDRFHGAAGDRPAHALQLRQLLTRFVAVCQTIAFAHSKGVIHRDLKPQNIMLGNYAETLVVDWGLARLSDEAAAGASEGEQPAVPAETLTQQGQVMGTPAYMSPEQAAGRHAEIGPASDIYSLGATLYALLTGRPPFRGGGDVLALVRAGRFPRPSEVRKDVPRALEAVCLKAMAADPHARYRSAADLAQDVERWLADEPVSACRQPLADRARRWLKRHRMLVTGAAAAAAVALLTLSVSTAWLKVARDNEEQAKQQAEQALAKEHKARLAEQQAAAEARRQQGNAEESYRLARTTLEEVMKLQDDPRFAHGPLEDVRQTLRRQEAKFYQQFLKLRRDDRVFQVERATALEHLAFLTQQLQSPAEALPLYEQARALCEELVRTDPQDHESAYRLGIIHNNLGKFYDVLDRPVDAERSFLQALAVLGPLGRVEARYARYEAGAHTNLGNLLRRSNRTAEALRCYERARALLQELVDQHPEVGEYRADLGRACNSIALHLAAAGQPAEALKTYRQARDLLRLLVDAFPKEGEFQAELAITLLNRAHLHRDLGQLDNALQAAEEARTLREELVRTHPLVPEYQSGLAVCCNTLGGLHRQRGEAKDSLKRYEQAEALLEKMAQPGAAGRERRRELAGVRHNLGEAYRDAGQLDRAAAAYQQAEAVFRELVRGRPQELEYREQLALTLNNQATLARARGQVEASLKLHEEARQLRTGLVTAAPQSPHYQAELAQSEYNIGNLYRDTRRPEEARKAYARSRELLRPLVERHPEVPRYRSDLADACSNLGKILVDTKRGAEGLPLHTEARALLKELSAKHPEVVDYRRRLARLHLHLGNAHGSLGQAPAALSCYQEARLRYSELSAKYPQEPAYRKDQAIAGYNVAVVQSVLGQKAEARKSYEEALALLEPLAENGPADREVQTALGNVANNLGTLLLAAKEFGPARKTLGRAQVLREQLLAGAAEDIPLRIGLGGTYVNLGNVDLTEGKAAAALTWFDRALPLLTDAHQRAPANPEGRLFLFNAHTNRAMALDSLRRHRDAAKDWGKAAELASAAARTGVSLARASSLAQAGDHAAATTSARGLLSKSTPAVVAYRVAAVYALAAATARKDEKLTPAERDELAERYAVEAMALLRRLVQAGFRDPTPLQRDPALAALRSRADFQKLLKEIGEGPPR